MHDIFVIQRRLLNYVAMQPFFHDLLNLWVKVKIITQGWVVVFHSLTSKIHPKVRLIKIP